MKNKVEVSKPFKYASLILFLLLSFGVLSCNNADTREEQNEMIQEEGDMPHDEHMMEEEMPHEDMMEEDTIHDERMHGDTLMHDGV